MQQIRKMLNQPPPLVLKEGALVRISPVPPAHTSPPAESLLFVKNLVLDSFET